MWSSVYADLELDWERIRAQFSCCVVELELGVVGARIGDVFSSVLGPFEARISAVFRSYINYYCFKHLLATVLAFVLCV